MIALVAVGGVVGVAGVGYLVYAWFEVDRAWPRKPWGRRRLPRRG